jgi:apolipoprotein N-acyltransferase
VIRERRKNHRSIGCEQVEEHMADENQKTDFVITPEMGPPCDFGKKPTKEERIKREKEERMGEVTMVLEIELTVDEAKEKVRVGKESRH